MSRADSYPPIRDYAVIGDCHGCALVSRDGRIDWCALQRFDADPVFLRLLDAGRGGFWEIAPLGEYRVERQYLADTAILQTEFITPDGRLRLTDFMPVGRKLDAGTHDYVNLNAPGWLVRRLEGLSGEVALRMRYRPSRAYAAEPVRLRQLDGRLQAEGLPVLFADLDFQLQDDLAEASLTLAAGETRDLVLAATNVERRQPRERVAEFLAVTTAFWREWLDYCRYRGPHEAMVRRSALTLKLMTYAPSGGLAAALTTSLPEEIGGERNWDYRYCWLRDGCFTLYALAVLGYHGEASRFHDYLIQACGRTLPEIQIMYGIDGEPHLPERTLDHLSGYRDSRPVRVGNEAHIQRQMDIYGQVLDLALLYRRLGGHLSQQYRRLLTVIARFSQDHWQEPDQGLWEMRGPARHHLHGKLMSWVAMDRARRLFGADEGWYRIADEIARRIRQEGVDPAGYLRQAFDGGVDAAVLLAPMLGFELAPGVLDATVAKVQETLGRGDYLRRYLDHDGLEGEEGAFLICSFWLVDALLASDRGEEAEALFGRLLECANDVGLYAEEVEPESHEFLGNFPQAFTHLAVIGSAVNLDLYRRHGAAGVRGSYADRAARQVSTTFGWRGIFAAIRQCGRAGRLWPSRRSKLAWP